MDFIWVTLYLDFRVGTGGVTAPKTENDIVHDIFNRGDSEKSSAYPTLP